MARHSHLATIEPKSAPLSGDFGRDYACKTFGLTPTELEAIVGRYVRGKRKGELRGEIRWLKVTRGGWLRTGPSYAPGERTAGHVVRPGLRFGHAIVNPWQSDDRGQPKVLWDDTFRRWGWIPGETREQYDTRQKARLDFLRPLQKRAMDKALAIVKAMSDDELHEHITKRHARRLRPAMGQRTYSYSLDFVSAALNGELSVRVANQGAAEEPNDVAHLWVRDHFDELSASGDVVDVEFILGETIEPKRSEKCEVLL